VLLCREHYFPVGRVRRDGDGVFHPPGVPALVAARGRGFGGGRLADEALTPAEPFNDRAEYGAPVVLVDLRLVGQMARGRKRDAEGRGERGPVRRPLRREFQEAETVGVERGPLAGRRRPHGIALAVLRAVASQPLPVLHASREQAEEVQACLGGEPAIPAGFGLRLRSLALDERL
jgi:hypothetical protein